MLGNPLQNSRSCSLPQNIRTLQGRAREFNSARSVRLASLRQHVSAIRERESSTERSQRLANQNIRTAHAHARESNSARSQVSGVRDTESSAERSHCIATEKQRISITRVRNRIVAHGSRSGFNYMIQI